MASAKLPKWAQLTSLGLILALVLLVVALNFFRGDPCTNMTTAELVAFYPELDALARKHQLDTDKLLTLHRTQDVLVNLKMTSEQMDPERALQISMQQIKELAAMREAQLKEFNTLCRKLIKVRW